jgi:Outer membrane protein beta-barrel domain
MKKLQSQDLGINKIFQKLVLSSMFFLLSFTTIAQNKWAFEIKPGINFPTKDLGDATLETGYGFEGVVSYKFMPHIAAYAGWGWNNFNSDKSFAGNNIDFTETGYSFGLQFLQPIDNAFIGYMIKAGGTYNHIEIENAGGEIINDTGHGLAWQVGVGLPIYLNKRLIIIPECRYRSLSRSVDINEVNTPVKLNYISASVGVSYSF